MTWNPFRYFADERAKDRETLLAALDKIFEAQRDQSAVAIEQARAMRTFIDSFTNFTGETSRRVSTDVSEAEAEQALWHLHGGES